MPILLNKELVVTEVMELARLKIASIIKMPPEIVKARWEHKDGKLTPAFDVDMTKIGDITEDEVRQSMGAVWRWLKDSLHERLEGLRQTRA